MPIMEPKRLDLRGNNSENAEKDCRWEEWKFYFTAGLKCYMAVSMAQVCTCGKWQIGETLKPILQPYQLNYSGPPSFATVMLLESGSQVTVDWVRRKLEAYRSMDDVFCDDFLTGVIFTGTITGVDYDISPEANEYLRSLGTTWIEVSDDDTGAMIPPPGSYLAMEGRLLEILLLYDDVQGAFMSGVLVRPNT